MFSKTIPVQVIHYSRAYESSVDPAFDKIARQSASACCYPEADVNAPVLLIIPPGGTDTSLVRFAERGIAHEFMITHGSQSVLIVNMGFCL